MKSVESGNVGSARELLDKGANVNEQTPNGRNALHWAFLKRQATPEMVRLLLDRGIDVNQRDGDSRTALFWAVSTNASPEVTRLLLDRGAYPGIGGKTFDTVTKTWKVRTPLQLAQERGMTTVAAMLSDAEQKQTERFVPSASAPARVGDAAPRGAVVRSDVDDPPMVRAKPDKRFHAIVIGVEQYRQKLPPAEFAVHDARTVATYLTQAMGYPEENVITLTNDRAAKSDLEKYFEKWLVNNTEPGGTVFVYYSGHGAPNPATGDAFLVPYDGDPAFIDQTGYSLKRLYQHLAKLPAREVVVVLDSCFSGAGGRSVLAKGARPLVVETEGPAAARNMAVLSAASGGQISSTYGEKGHGLFTYFLLKGIKGEADLNEDGKVELTELFSYVKPQVEKTARKSFNAEQTPQLTAPAKQTLYLRK